MKQEAEPLKKEHVPAVPKQEAEPLKKEEPKSDDEGDEEAKRLNAYGLDKKFPTHLAYGMPLAKIRD